MDSPCVPDDIDADDDKAGVSCVPGDFYYSDDEQDLVLVLDSVDCDDMIVPDDMDLFIELPEITNNRVNDWAAIVRAEVVRLDTLHYIMIDDEDEDFIDILVDDPNPFVIDITDLNEHDEDDNAM
jgi:hypothetical protein